MTAPSGLRRALPLALAAAVLAAAPLVAQAPVPFRTPEMEIRLPPGFPQPERVGGGEPGAPAAYLATLPGGGGTMMITVATMPPEELAEHPTRLAVLEAVMAVLRGHGAVAGERTPVEDSVSIGFIARLREAGRNEAPLVRASITRAGRSAVLVLVILGPTFPDAPPPPEYLASLASLRLRAPDAPTP